MSNRKCCVPGCVKSSETKVNLHTFPNPDKAKELFNTWVYSVGGDILKLENNHISKYRRVCHAHFENKYHCWNNRISNNAVPTINMPGLSISKFHPTALRPLQISEASTSKGPLAPQVYTHAIAEDQMNENLETNIAPEDINMDVNLYTATIKTEDLIKQDFNAEGNERARYTSY
ncbi:unnamed protein product [Leptidea sinapis]|uniref:THAP-type domain-containing protein n=1 Tax=Leptidea sinapis TaxID=189913 RepID=A0A5E4QAK7_9NEOP|nr:unnamed protein product [Leptidea sinapis]